MSSKPLLVIVSSEPRLHAELTGLMTDRFELLACDSLAEAEELLPGRTPASVVFDCQGLRGGGHRESHFLEVLSTKIPDLDLVVLAGEECPEPIARRVATATSGRITQQRNANELAELLSQRFPVPQEKQAAVSDDTFDAAADPFADVGDSTTLNGMTRRFATNSPRMKQMLADLEVAARHNVTILLIGETGSGKTFLSRLIHEVSQRREDPFLHVACGALPAELIESELFGHVKGAFTSAHADKEGKFVAAGRGTVLLDEIDVLGPEQQVKLLRAIETGEFEPVGSNQTLRSEARLVVASNLQLQPLVEQGRFRPDLYYRLNMLKFEIAPLRERTCDIVPLAKTFIRQSAERHGVTIQRVERSLYEALQFYPWPGNVRELENVIQRAVIYTRDGVMTSRQLPDHIVNRFVGPTNDPSVRLGNRSESETSEPQTLDTQIQLTEKEIIEQALFRNNFSRTNTAKELGISRVTLYNKMKKYEM